MLEQRDSAGTSPWIWSTQRSSAERAKKPTKEANELLTTEHGVVDQTATSAFVDMLEQRDRVFSGLLTATGADLLNGVHRA